MTASPAWLAVVEAMLNRHLDESAQAVALARRLEGRSLQVEATSLLTIRAAVNGGRMALSSGGETAADATISGSALALMSLLRAEVNHPVRSDSAGKQSAVQVRGDADVANRFRELLTLARPDIETEIARFIGAIPARALATRAQAAANWSGRAVKIARANIAEYLSEESRDLVNKTELAEFLRGVDQARDAADRAEARLAQLERRTRPAL